MNDLTSILVEMFRRGMFGFITEVGGKRHAKQREALEVLTDPTMRELMYGGAAGGAKSWTGAAWVIFSALAYPGTRWFVGRNQLNDLRRSTSVTMGKVFNAYGITDTDYRYNGNDSYYQFSNGSTIEFIQLRYLPTDPMYERFGSKEYTAGWIEEAGEVTEKSFEVLRTRVGRHNNDRYCLAPVIFITANPKKNWLYNRYYKPFVAGTLTPDVRFIPSLVDDNPFIESVYKENLEKLTDKVAKARLLHGEWDYDNNPNALIDRLALDALFNNPLADRSGYYYLTADVARLGSDRSVIIVWRGHTAVHIEEHPLNRTTDISGRILALMSQYRIPRYRAVADEDGVGGGVVDVCRIQGFHNGGKVFNGENFANLKTQCIYKTAADVNDNIYGIDAAITSKQAETIREELEQLQNAAPDTDGKMKAKSKEDIKRDIGRSPDYADAFIMRKQFDLKRVQNDRVTAVVNDYAI